MSTYNKTVWQDGDIITADKMNNIENGIYSYNEDITNLIRTPEQTGADFYICDPSGNVLAEFRNGHLHTKNFDSADALTADDLTEIETAISSLTETVEAAPTAQDLQDLADDIQDVSDSVVEVSSDVSKLPEIRIPTTQAADFYIVDSEGNVLVEFSGGHVKTKNFDSSLTAQDAVKTVNNTRPDTNGNVNVTAALDPTELQTAVDEFLTDHPVVASAAGVVSVADYGAVGDGVTDDSAAIQNAVNSNYDVYFESDKTYFLGSTVTINHDIKLHGGKNTVIKTATPENAAPYNGIEIKGTLKTTTTLTSDYYAEGDTDLDNISNRFTLADMSNVEIGDIIQIRATDQFYSYSRRYYYLGAVLAVTDIYDGHIYTNRNMPWDIALTDKVKVWIYSAPSVQISDLEFVGDLNAFGSEYKNSYASLLYMSWCRNSVIKHCNFNHMKLALYMQFCVNTHIDMVEMSKSRYENTEGLGDGYGIDIFSCTHTTVERVNALCSQGCIDMGGWEPCLDTFITKCDLMSECRSIGIDMHDNSYNMVIEDCVLGGLSLFGNARVNRCQFVRNVRSGGYGGLTFRGFANAKWANLHVTDCTFPVNASCYISLRPQLPQDYVQASDSIIGEVLIENCVGGGIQYEVATSAYVLSNVIEKLVLRNCKSMTEIYHKDGVIKDLIIDDCTFLEDYYLNRHTGTINVDDIYCTKIKTTLPYKDMLFVNSDGPGDQFILPEGIEIGLSSNDTEAEYIVCGKNIASDDNADYSVGLISGSVGNDLTKTPDATATGFLSSDSSGNLVYTIPSGYTTKRFIYPKCMVSANRDEAMRLSISMKVKNSGSTEGSSFRLYIVVVDCKTGKVVYNNHSSVYGQATAEGFALSHTRTIPKGCAAFWCLYCYTVIAGSETIIEKPMASLTAIDQVIPSYVAYNGSKRIGNGSLQSVAGQNNVLSSVNDFNINFQCDYADNAF